MQKRKIEDSAIFQSYSRIMSGESLTAVAKEMKLDRGTLRNYIKTVVEPELDEIQREKFYKIINRNYRGNSTENKRKNRNGKKKINDSELIEKLASYGVTPQETEDLYEILRRNKRTRYVRDTYIYKCLEHLETLTELGFSTKEIFSIFMQRPKLFSGNASKMVEIYNIYLRKFQNQALARQKMIEDPWEDLETDKTSKKVEDGGER